MKLPPARIERTTLWVDAKKVTNWNNSFDIRKQNCWVFKLVENYLNSIRTETVRKHCNNT
jgi:hypothetical protein